MDWQHQLLVDWDDQEHLDAVIDALAGARCRPRRIVRDRMNPFTSMSDDEFVDRFRLRKVSVLTLLEEVRNELPAPTDLRVEEEVLENLDNHALQNVEMLVQGNRNMAGRLKRQNIIRDNF
ncbi:hypothetical protein Pcinc_006326 [Petrolisthes cinctipes]|uniref:Uncharacterized protein n=1 Tax=Petrolisthes cinctipes TaxID=88211 RepID=A0AAE1KZB5_PETCI|nr:hypothetical protein Pcinc_006326 [Petrolisthes cinctipes]